MLVLPVSDILEHNGVCNGRSVVILLVFLSYELIAKRNTDQLNFHKFFGFNCQSQERKSLSTDRWFVHPEAVLNHEETERNSIEDTTRNFKDIMSWWQAMAKQNSKCDLKPSTPSVKCYLTARQTPNMQTGKDAENYVNELKVKAAFRIQLAWKKHVIFKSLRGQHTAATKIQSHVRCWLARKSFAKKKQAIIKIQSIFRCIKCRRDFQHYKLATKAAIIIQSQTRGWIVRTRAYRLERFAVVIQRHCRGWLVRKELLLQREAAIRIQTAFRFMKCQKEFHSYRHAAIKLQSFVRGQITRKRLIGASCLHKDKTIGYSLRTSRGGFQSLELKIFLNSVVKLQRWWRSILLLKAKSKSTIIIQSHIRGWIARCRATRERRCIVAIQRRCRGWLVRREFLLQRETAIRIQTSFRFMKYQKVFHSYRQAAIKLQSFVRGQITRKRLLGASCLLEAKTIGISTSRDCLPSLELQIFLNSVLKLQRWWRDVSLLKLRMKSAIIIQSHIRGWISRRGVARKKGCIILIQSFWKGYLARRDSREELLDLRLRIKKSAANVDDGMRIMNRLLSALSELLNKKSASGILHICQTLDMATEHSEKCCEKLVAAGAVDTLLKLIRSVSRSVPDQVVLKHVLLTLRNLVRYPHLSRALIDCPGSIQIILMEFLRNKEEGYFIASEILTKIFSTRSGVEATCNVPFLLKRLRSLVGDLTRKAHKEKRNARALVVIEHTEKRLREAVQLMKLLTKC